MSEPNFKKLNGRYLYRHDGQIYKCKVLDKINQVTMTNVNPQNKTARIPTIKNFLDAIYGKMLKKL